MPNCVRCFSSFDITSAQHEYDAEFGGDPDNDETIEGQVCATCAISNTNIGAAIDMVNGDDDHDAEFVEK